MLNIIKVLGEPESPGKMQDFNEIVVVGGGGGRNLCFKSDVSGEQNQLAHVLMS